MLVSRNPIIALTTVGVLVVLLRTVPVSRSEETRLEIRTAAGDNRAAEEPGWVKFHVRDKRLLLDNRQLDRNVIRVISTFVELQELCLIRCGLVDEDIIHLSKLTNLEILNLSENDITDSGGAHVGRLQKLVYVDLSKTKVGDRTVEALGACGELTGLQLESTQVHGDSLACLSNCRNLRRLSLRRDRIDARYWPGIGTLASLRNLDISLTNLSGSDLQFLAPLVNLQELSVTKLRDVQDESIEVVSELALLTHLSIGHTRITNKGVQQLTSLKHLKSLDISRTSVTDSVLEIIEKTPRWIRVDINNCNIQYSTVFESSAIRRVVANALGPPVDPPPDLNAIPDDEPTEIQ